MLSVLLCIKNEQAHLQACLNTLSFADEIVVIDDESVDQSADIAKKPGSKYFCRKMDDDWSAQRNFGIEQCTGDWILVVDADERVSQELARSITSVIQNDKISPRAYLIKRENYFDHQEPLHGVLRADWVKRLFPKEGAHYEGRVHEKVMCACSTEKLYVGALIHFPYDGWDEYFEKFNRYTRLRAMQYRESKENNRVGFLLDIVLKPLWAFIKTYLIDRGFLDGKIGFILSVNHAFYTMSKYVRMLEVDQMRS